MSRQAHYISRLSSKDEKLLYVLKNAQHVSQAQILLMITRSRVENFLKEGVIRKVHYIADGRQQTAYELTRKGQQFIKERYPQWGNAFYSSGTAIRHNIELASQVMLHADTKTWINERELRNIVIDRIVDSGEMRFHYLQQMENRELSIPDGAIVNRETGQIEELIEIVNDNYGNPELAAKEIAADVLGVSVSFVRQ